MDIKLLKKQDNNFSFMLKDSNPATANTLRRIMLSEVPTLAIKKVTFVKNSSALFDEILAHRLGMLPLVTDLDSYVLPEQCSCKGAGCAKCQVTFTLKAEGPLTVYASDLKSQDPKIKPVFAKMPLVQLLKDQEVEFEAVATLGIAKEHAKYTPGLISFKGNPIIKIGKIKDPEGIAASCPTNVYEAKGKELKVIDNQRCTLCNACLDAKDPKDELTVEGSEEDFLFTIESYGKLKPEEILNKALDILAEKLDTFEVAFNK